MKIEIGKSYLSRDGQKVVIAAAFSGHGDDYPYIGTWRGQLASYSPEGRSGVPLDKDREWDLIAEWEESAPTKPANWEWLGHAQHFCGSSYCKFHLGTKVGPWIVSTVGDYFPLPDRVRRPLNAPIEGETPLYYETMVFPVVGALDCGCPDHRGSEVDGRRYATAQEATAGHMELCRRWESVPKAEAAEENQ